MSFLKTFYSWNHLTFLSNRINVHFLQKIQMNGLAIWSDVKFFVSIYKSALITRCSSSPFTRALSGQLSLSFHIHELKSSIFWVFVLESWIMNFRTWFFSLKFFWLVFLNSKLNLLSLESLSLSMSVHLHKIYGCPCPHKAMLFTYSLKHVRFFPQ